MSTQDFKHPTTEDYEIVLKQTLSVKSVDIRLVSCVMPFLVKQDVKRPPNPFLWELPQLYKNDDIKPSKATRTPLGVEYQYWIRLSEAFYNAKRMKCEFLWQKSIQKSVYELRQANRKNKT